MDNTSTPSRRSSRRATRSAPAEVAARSESPTSAISALTDSSTRQQIEDRNNLSLAQLSNVASLLVIERPLPVLTAIEEENAYDMRAYNENPGAEDSEEEDKAGDEEEKIDEDDDVDGGTALMLDALFAAEDTAIPSEEIVEGMEAGNDTDVWAYGAPPGWIPPGIPEGWKPNKPRGNQPKHFDSVDNPGGWSHFFLPSKVQKGSRG